MDWWTFTSRASDVLGLFGVVAAGMAWLRTTELIQANKEARERREAPITIELENKENKDSLEIPYKPRRDQLSRAELLGILGMYCGKPSFDRSLLFDIFKDGTFDRILAGKAPASTEDRILRITCPPEIYKDFERVIASLKSTPPTTSG